MSPLTEKQQAIRTTGVGSSEVAAIVGIVPGAISVWERKQPGMAPPDEPNDLMEFGSRIEDVIGDAYQARHPTTRLYSPGTLRHAKHVWALATPDRVEAPPGIGRPPREAWLRLWEAKTVFFSARDFTDTEVPERYLTQVQWQLEVADIDLAVLVGLINGRYQEYPVERDREIGGLLIEIVGRWWTDHVVANRPPPPDGSDAYKTYLRRRFPRDTRPVLPLSSEAEVLVARFRETKAAAKTAAEAEALAQQALEQFLGEAGGVEGLCTWRNNKDSKRTDWEAVAAELLRQSGLNQPAREKFLARFTTTKAGARVLRLKEK